MPSSAETYVLTGSRGQRKAELGELGGFDRRGGAEHQVGAAAGLGEGLHLADVVLVGQQSDPAVDAQRDAAVRRGAVLERVEDRAELGLLGLDAVALEHQRALEQVVLVDADRPAAQLPAVEHQVVLERARLTSRIGRG